MTAERSQLLVNKDQVCRLYEVWSELPGDKPRQALDPLALGAPLLPHLALLRALPDDFRYDLVGEKIGELSPGLRPGSTAGRLPESENGSSNVFRLMRAVAESRQPGAQFSAFEGPSGIERRCFSMVFPLSMTGTSAHDLLIGIWPMKRRTGLQDGAETEQVASVAKLVAELSRQRHGRLSRPLHRIAFGGESLASR